MMFQAWKVTCSSRCSNIFSLNLCSPLYQENLQKWSLWPTPAWFWIWLEAPQPSVIIRVPDNRWVWIIGKRVDAEWAGTGIITQFLDCLSPTPSTLVSSRNRPQWYLRSINWIWWHLHGREVHDAKDKWETIRKRYRVYVCRGVIYSNLKVTAKNHTAGYQRYLKFLYKQL